MASGTDIIIKGAREHNLRGIDVVIPRNKLTVITGLSGSGKSSLAFDTLYAEGQRRYVESLSAYARQFLGQMQKPDADLIEGLSPAIAIEQRTAGNNPRSIVATTTEIHDYLRLLYGNVGHAHCPKCGRPVERQNAEQIVTQLLALPEKTRLTILAPVVRRRKGAHTEVLDALRREGFARARIDGTICELDDAPELDKKKNHEIEVVIDRVVVSASAHTRLTDSVELALKRGAGTLVTVTESGEEKSFSELNACIECGISFEELKPANFSFNNPHGACNVCAGLGSRLVFVEELVVPDPRKSLDAGAIRPWRVNTPVALFYKHLLRGICEAFKVDIRTPYEELPREFRDVLMNGSGEEPVKINFRTRRGVHVFNKPFEGVLPSLVRRYTEAPDDEHRAVFEPYMRWERCPACHGARLRPEARAVRVADVTLVEVMSMTIRRACEHFAKISLSAQEMKIAAEIIKEIRRRLQFLVDVGLDYLTLDRESSTLSGGEMQRIRLATQIGAGLVGVLYVLDEPTIGLHPRDNARLVEMLRRLQMRGNTVVVVEHDEAMIRAADHIIDLGPGAGRNGGNVVFQGSLPKLLEAQTRTADYLTGRRRIEAHGAKCENKKQIVIKGAKANNLRGINVTIPLGELVCITGVSGSGKSTLVEEVLLKNIRGITSRKKVEKFVNCREIEGLENIDKVIEIDQSPIGRTPRSNPATYTDAMTPIRNLFAMTPAAKMRGYGPGRFSFNVKGGRCEACRGDGTIKVEMHFLPDVFVPCEQCGGARYNSETLQVRYAGRNISEVLSMTVDEALEVFSAVNSIGTKLRTLSEVGLGYLQLGQASTTLSGGEAQRIKLAAELCRPATGKTIYLLDEPTTGLHFADVEKLLEVLLRLRDAGNSVLVIEHNSDIIRNADYIIDLGPEGGDGGGSLVACGPPEKVARCEKSYTGRALRGEYGH